MSRSRSRILVFCLLCSISLPRNDGAAGDPATKANPRSGWRFAFNDFMIAAWSPPNATEAEYALYRDAGFNVVMSPRYAFPKESLDLAERHGLQVMVDTYTPNDKPWGGKADAYTPHPSHHPATLTELKWLHESVGKHRALAGYLLGDDIGGLPKELIETTNFLREVAPHLFPWVCQCTYAWESLAKNGNPIADPQIYPTLYQAKMPPVFQRDEYCRVLDRLRRACRKHRLVSWPMFNVCGQESSGPRAVVSDPFLRFQPYAALAYGAQGIWYFTWRCLPDYSGGEAEPTPALDIVKQVNQRVAVWGPNLLGCEPVGVFHSDFRVEGSHCPGAKHFVRSMSENLLVGLLVGPDKAVYAVVVDKRVGLEEEPSGNREVEVTFAPEVKTISLLAAPQVKGQKRAGPRFKLTLEAGEGLLLRLEGAGLAERARQAESEGGSRPRPAGKVGPDGLVLRLSFDEGKGNVAHDSSPAKNDAFLCGAKWADGKFGKALDLRGDADLAQIPGAFLPAKHAMTVSCWVNPKYPAEGYGPVILIGSGGVDRFEFGFGPDNLYPVISDQETHSGGNLYVDGMKALLPEGAWGHIAIAAGPNGATTYIGGVPRSTTTYRGRFDFQTPLIQLGCRQNENYTGLLDELRVYNRCMSAQEVRKLHGDTRR